MIADFFMDRYWCSMCKKNLKPKELKFGFWSSSLAGAVCRKCEKEFPLEKEITKEVYDREILHKKQQEDLVK